jgi:hypothetical protein
MIESDPVMGRGWVQKTSRRRALEGEGQFCLNYMLTKQCGADINIVFERGVTEGGVDAVRGADFRMFVRI